MPQSKGGKKRCFYLPYRLGGPGSEKLCSSRKGCKKKLLQGQCKNKDCPLNQDKEGGSERSRGKRRMSEGEAATKRRATVEAAQARLHATWLPKEEMVCPHFFSGKCFRGLRCSHKHPGTRSDWAQISCRNPRSRDGTGVCMAHPHCMYKECYLTSEAARNACERVSTSGRERKHREVKLPIWWRANRRAPPVKFIYGTEAIMFVLPPLRVVSHNLSGVKSGTRLRQVFAAARAAGAHVHLAQEHGLHAEDESRLKDVAHEFGFWVEASFIEAACTRGGTWVALSMQEKGGAFRLTKHDTLARNRQTLGGRVTVVQVPWDRFVGEAEVSGENIQPFGSVFSRS